MRIKTIKVGPLQTNCYLVVDEATNQAIIVDPGDEAEKIISEIGQLNIIYLVLTHHHYDHVGALEELGKKTKAKLIINQIDGAVIKFGNLSFEIIKTPGHAAESVCLYFKAEKVLFSGDTLFAATYGRTDLPGSSPREMVASLRRLSKLPAETVVYPGHEASTTIALEKERGTLD